MHEDKNADRSLGQSPAPVLQDRIGHYQAQLGEAMTSLLTEDRGQENGYKIKIVENPHVLGLTNINEEGPGWTRRTRVYSQDYDELPAGTVEQEYEEADGAKKLLTIKTIVNPNRGLSQSIVCSVDRASKHVTGRQPLVPNEEEFFSKLSPSGLLRGEISISPNGEVKTQYSSESSPKTGFDSWGKTITVTSTNGKVTFG